ncbi:subtilisin-like protease SBT4.3 [Magnolia sinica]|uniref:subtilisin-like protease SBT4.3 n=1 Tax=Magnolia sinica TaxID=86752 RepID=UPI002659B4BF|nr:subtilisin-like protease SBT4.3 [Magnolia sinica]
MRNIDRKARGGNLILKLDLEKAYDRVDWVFLKKVMRRFGFSDRWIFLMEACWENCWMPLSYGAGKIKLAVEKLLPPSSSVSVYIVYLGDLPKNEFPVETLHHSILEQVLESGSARDYIVYSFKKSFNGFAARLTEQEQQKLSGMEGIVSVFPSKAHKLHTTRSWNFLGFPTSVKRWPDLESDVIVGVLDTGIWPESDSFRDVGIGPPPSKWKGSCQNITCNNKVIGARFYNVFNDYDREEPSPRDVEGHGTHTSSTVAGREVKNASLFHLAKGIARGAVPSTRIAIYKVCWSFGCMDHDILAAFDDAIHDGVDILSMSLGKSFAFDYFMDSQAIGSFHAMKNGILVSASVGNNGPTMGTATNIAPWMLTVAASTIDRRFTTKLTLGNQRTLVGISLNTFATQKKFSPLLLVPTQTDIFGRKICSLGPSKNASFVERKILCCEGRFEQEIPTTARGMVMINDIRNDTAFSYNIPSLVLGSTKGRDLLRYLNKTRNPVARIHKSQAVFDPKAPKVASFSSRGPNTVTRDILKPDISAPGVDILAAWSPKASISMLLGDKRSSKYNIDSGTSMACPHVTGVAAYVKSFHPSWSPAAIKSAIMTTASPIDGSNSPDYEFGYGAGNIDPLKAVHPGLVYDAFEADYIQMLCSEGYSAEELSLVTGVKTNCTNATIGSSRDLNYPSMVASISEPNNFTKTFLRTVTNVGLPNSMYKAIIKSHPQVQITIEPSVLHFKSVYEKLSFTVTVSGGPLTNGAIASSSLVWSNEKHWVRSPIVVYSNANPSSGSSLPSMAPAPSPSA